MNFNFLVNRKDTAHIIKIKNRIRFINHRKIYAGYHYIYRDG